MNNQISNYEQQLILKDINILLTKLGDQRSFNANMNIDRLLSLKRELILYMQNNVPMLCMLISCIKIMQTIIIENKIIILKCLYSMADFVTVIMETTTIFLLNAKPARPS